MHPYMLAAGNSYSTVYLTEARALVTYLALHYKRTGIVGLSQGGLATMYVGLQAEPDFAVVASGFALSMNPAVMGWVGGFDQIVVPGAPDAWSLVRIGRELRRPSTEWVFSMGLLESGPVGNEARTGATCEWLEPKGVKCLVHSGGHEFPMKELRRLTQ